MATLNIGLKVNRAITGATTVSANAVAIVTYVYSMSGNKPGSTSADTASPRGLPPINRVFGPGQSIPASFTHNMFSYLATSLETTVSLTGTYSLVSGVELINTQ